ncbi:MAG: hypothetical protein IKE43_12535 [Coriobacteriales bacterium]|nr:hypothetical protein [Coriobacteriales bacterium]
MLDGKYDITIHVPFHKITGTVTFKTSKDGLSAELESMGKAKKAVGTFKDNAFSFEGDINSPLGATSVKLDGKVEGDDLNAQAITKFGTFKVTGKRKA